MFVAQIIGRSPAAHVSAPVDKQKAPATKYDVAIYLCNAVNSFKGSPCGTVTTTTSEQKQALVSELQEDPRVTSYVFVSEEAQFALGRRTMPSAEVELLHPGVLPAAYFVALDSSADSPSVVAAYQAVPGVSSVVACVRQPQCQVPQLRAVGVVK